jgi:hypothetical protein
LIVVSGPEIVTWVHLKLNSHCPDRNLAQGLGWCDPNPPHHIRAGVTYHNWNGYNVDASVAIDDGFQWTRARLRTLFEYPFTQLGARRMSALIEHDNTRSRQFVERLGFTLEATLADACKAGDLLLYRLTFAECRWLK